jgi:N-acetylglucosamine-6-sulfatase
MQEDPLESRNLIADPRLADVVKQMRERLFDVLEKTDGMNIPLQRDRGGVNNKRNEGKGKAADFPAEIYKAPGGPTRHN